MAAKSTMFRQSQLQSSVWHGGVPGNRQAQTSPAEDLVTLVGTLGAPGCHRVGSPQNPQSENQISCVKIVKDKMPWNGYPLLLTKICFSENEGIVVLENWLKSEVSTEPLARRRSHMRLYFWNAAWFQETYSQTWWQFVITCVNPWVVWRPFLAHLQVANFQTQAGYLVYVEYMDPTCFNFNHISLDSGFHMVGLSKLIYPKSNLIFPSVFSSS